MLRDFEVNSLEKGRIEIGMTRAQALALVGAKPGRLSLLERPDSYIDPAFVERMAEAVAAYRSWTGDMLARLEARERSGQGPLDMQELSQLTGIREVNLIALRFRGVLGTETVNGIYCYPLASVRQFIKDNSTVLREGQRKSRGPLAGAFLRWLRRSKSVLVMA